MDSSDRELGPKEVRRSAVSLGAGFLVLGGLLWWRGTGGAGFPAWTGSLPQRVAVAAWALGAAVVLIGLFRERPARWIVRAWTRFAGIVHRALSRILLLLVYFLVLPLFLPMRLSDPLRIRPRSRGWIEREPEEPTIDRARQPF